MCSWAMQQVMQTLTSKIETGYDGFYIWFLTYADFLEENNAWIKNTCSEN